MSFSGRHEQICPQSATPRDADRFAPFLRSARALVNVHVRGRRAKRTVTARDDSLHEADAKFGGPLLGVVFMFFESMRAHRHSWGWRCPWAAWDQARQETIDACLAGVPRASGGLTRLGQPRSYVALWCLEEPPEAAVLPFETRPNNPEGSTCRSSRCVQRGCPRVSNRTCLGSSAPSRRRIGKRALHPGALEPDNKRTARRRY